MSFASVLAEFEAVEVPADGASLAAGVRAFDRYTARLTMAVAAYDASGEWEVGGWTSVIAWLRDLGFTHGDAAEMARMGSKLRRLPVTAAAWLEGRLTVGQVKVICAQVIDRHVDRFAQHEATLVPTLSTLDWLGTLTAMRVWRARADALDDGQAPDDRVNTAHLSSTLDDRGELTATLDAEGYGLAKKAFEIADSGDLDVPAPLRRGQALVDILRWFLDNQNRNAAGRNRPHLNIVINAATLGTPHVEGYDATTGMNLPSATLERMLCDCDMHRVVAAGSEILDYGRKTRTPPPELWNSVVLRDQRCRWKSCDRPPSWCHAHHVEEWDADHGPTAITNLVLFCERHHGMLHRTGWKARLEPDGTLHVTDPHHYTWTTRPPALVGLSPPAPPGYTDQDPFTQHLRWIEAKTIVRAWAQELTRTRAA